MVSKETLLRHIGRQPRETWPASVNIGPSRASTFTFATLASYLEEATRDRGLNYGRVGTPASVALQDAMTELDGGRGAVAYSSGLAAIVGSLLSHLSFGDHVLLPDSLYGSARAFCERHFPRQGIAFDYYCPTANALIADQIRPNTRVVYVESPGSATFEVQDIPAISSAAHAAGAIVIMDNTWATPLLFPALERGVDIAVYAGTKYLAGHSDAMIGICVCNERTLRRVKEAANDYGAAAGSEEVFLTLRGLRTLDIRLERHGINASRLADYLHERPEVESVLFPGLPHAIGHEFWKRDFLGASGLFSIVLSPDFAARAEPFVNGLQLFSIGASWGGFESIIKPFLPLAGRKSSTWEGRSLLRFHAGLENGDDLIADIERAFETAHRIAHSPEQF